MTTRELHCGMESWILEDMIIYRGDTYSGHLVAFFAHVH